jgi:site-specific recombinase XerD
MRSYAALNRQIAKRYFQWLVIQHYCKSTRYNYEQTIRLFLDFLGTACLTQVTHLEIRKFMLHLAESGVSIISARKHLLSLRRLYDFLNLGGLVNYTAPRLVIIRRTPYKVPLHLSETEVSRLIAAAQTPRERALVEVFYGTGCRMSEIRCLKVQDVDLKARTARVTGKFDKTRVVLLTRSSADAMRTYIGKRQVGYVFQQDYPDQKGTLAINHGAWEGRWWDHKFTPPRYRVKYLGSTAIFSREKAKAAFELLLKDFVLIRPKRNLPLTSTTIGNILRELARRAGLCRATAHMLRHTFARHLYDNGAELSAIQTLLGHVLIETTLRYTRTTSPFKLVDIFERCHPLGSRRGKQARSS